MADKPIDTNEPKRTVEELMAQLEKSLADAKAKAAATRYCRACDMGGHICPGCGGDVDHGETACDPCNVRADEERRDEEYAEWLKGSVR